jgi:hypothetical protein
MPYPFGLLRIPKAAVESSKGLPGTQSSPSPPSQGPLAHSTVPNLQSLPLQEAFCSTQLILRLLSDFRSLPLIPGPPGSDTRDILDKEKPHPLKCMNPV